MLLAGKINTLTSQPRSNTSKRSVSFFLFCRVREIDFYLCDTLNSRKLSWRRRIEPRGDNLQFFLKPC